METRSSETHSDQLLDGAHCVLRFPGFTEVRSLDRIPSPGSRIRTPGYWGRTWVVDEVFQTGADDFTVVLVSRREYRRKLQRRPSGDRDLSSTLLELARRAEDVVVERKHKRRYRNYVP